MSYVRGRKRDREKKANKIKSYADPQIIGTLQYIEKSVRARGTITENVRND